MDSELSYELIMEIISRTSLKTIDTMRCTSKGLNALAYESYLLDLYMKRNSTVSGFLIQHMRKGWMLEFAPSLRSSPLDLVFLPNNVRVLATCEQGMMVFMSRDPTDDRKELYHVCKPATKQVLALPNPKGKYAVWMKFAIVVLGMKPLHYKIIRFSDHPVLKRRYKFYRAYRCDIFDSLTWEWRSVNHVKLAKLAEGVFLSNEQPMTKSGSVYILLTDNNILKLDAWSEGWKVLRSPIPYGSESVDTSRPLVELLKYGGRLGLACKPPNRDGCWEIWVHTKGQVWEKVYVCKEKEDEGGSLKALYDLETSVMVDNTTLKFHKFKHEGDNLIRKVELSGFPYQIFSFRSDFEPIDLF